MLRALHAGLVAAYSPAELRELLTLRLGVELEHVSKEGTHSERVLDLVRWAERQGRLPELAQAAAASSPNNEMLRAAAMLVTGAGGSNGTHEIEVGQDMGIEYKMGNFDAQLDQLRSGQEDIRDELRALRRATRALAASVFLVLALVAWHMWNGNAWALSAVFFIFLLPLTRADRSGDYGNSDDSAQPGRPAGPGESVHARPERGALD